MLPDHLARQLQRRAERAAIESGAASTFSVMYDRTADALEDAGVPPAEAGALASDLVGGILQSLSGAGDAMVQAMARTASEARIATRQ